MRQLVALCAALLSLQLFAASVTVGCAGGAPGAYPSITAALAALDLDGPHTITVSGTCTESVFIGARERLLIQGGTVVGVGFAPAFTIRSSDDITLRNLVARGISSAIQIANNADVTMTGVIAENATNGFALDAFGGAVVNLGGPNAADAVTLRNSRFGMRCESCVAFFAGWVTIENHTGDTALAIEGGRVEGLGQRPASPSGPVQGGPIIIRNNAFNGVSVSNRGIFELNRLNSIQNNGGSGILLTDGTVRLLGSFTPDGTPMGTIIEGNARNAVSALFNATLSSSGPNSFQNNGSVGTPFTGGISATHSSVVMITGGQVTGSVGPGISADATANVRLNGVTVTGNSEEAVRLLHGSVLESVGGNVIPVPSVTCDGTSIVFGDFTGVGAFECDKATKK